MLPRGADSQVFSSADTASLSSVNNFADPSLLTSETISAGSSRCFPPNAVFQLADGAWRTASELRRDGGEVLRGPDNTCVRVIQTRRHPAERRVFLKIHTSKSMLEVTHDHRVIGQRPGESQITVAAEEMRPYILTGTGPEPVQRFEVDMRSSEVVEPIFEDDVPVLVWTRSGRRLKDATPERAFVVKGGQRDVYNLYEVKNGFFDDIRVPRSASMGRSRSADGNLAPFDQRRLARARSSTLSRSSAA